MLIRKFIVMSCIVWTITGCGITDQETASGDGTARTEESADRTDQHSGSQGETGAQGGTGSREEGAGQGEAGSQGETEGQETGAITVAQVKTVVLDNAGLSEDEVRFVRIHLDSENGRAEYDVEFVCRDAEYDYRVSAGTGEILAMNCEMGNYDVNTLPPDVAQAGNDPAPDSLAPDSLAPDAPQAGNGPAPDAPQAGNEPAPDTTQAGSAPAPDTSQADTVPESGGQYIGNEAAKQIALDHAGLTAEEVHFVHAHLEQDDGSWIYDIEFHKDNTEYDYDIHALTGEILSFDQDAEYYRHGADASAGEGQITEEEAREIALAYAGVTEEEAQRLKMEFDYDDGRGVYEVEWHVGRTEYSCDVDAGTGEVLSFEKELD